MTLHVHLDPVLESTVIFTLLLEQGSRFHSWHPSCTINYLVTQYTKEMQRCRTDLRGESVVAVPGVQASGTAGLAQWVALDRAAGVTVLHVGEGVPAWHRMAHWWHLHLDGAMHTCMQLSVLKSSSTASVKSVRPAA